MARLRPNNHDIAAHDLRAELVQAFHLLVDFGPNGLRGLAMAKGDLDWRLHCPDHTLFGSGDPPPINYDLSFPSQQFQIE